MKYNCEGARMDFTFCNKMCRIFNVRHILLAFKPGKPNF
jgi:hypothetical protein